MLLDFLPITESGQVNSKTHPRSLLWSVEDVLANYHCISFIYAASSAAKMTSNSSQPGDSILPEDDHSSASETSARGDTTLLFATEPQWKFRIGDQWTGIKSFTGFTSNACVFTSSAGAASPDDLEVVVIKQRDAKGDGHFTPTEGCDPVYSLGLKPEYDLYTLLSQTNSIHVIKMYRRFHEDIAQGTHVHADKGKQVERLYFEFCPGGNLRSLGSKLKGGLEEADVWDIFHQLALTCSVYD